MIGGPNPSIYNLANIFSANNTSLAQAMTRIASGKRVQVPGDDFAAYTRASALESDVAQYRTVKQDLQDGMAYTDYGTAVGNNILADLTAMKDLAESYGLLAAPLGADAAEAASLTAEFNSLKAGIASQVAASKYDNTAIYTLALAKTVRFDINGTALTITPTAVADASGLDITDGTAVADVQAQINAGETYVSDMESFGSQIDRQLKLTDTVISSKEATISVIIGNDDIRDMAIVTALQVRQQAAAAMMAQANVIQGYAAKLYGGNI